MNDFIRIPRVTKLLQLLSQQFDTSALASLIVKSILANGLTKEADAVVGSLLQDNLQACFAVTQGLLLKGIETQNPDETHRVRDLLNVVKSHCKDMFTQSCVYCLKQLADDPAMKERAFSLLQEHTQSRLITRFGDKEYTILSALGSTR